MGIRTRTHIQATRLMLPKTPERARLTSGDGAAVVADTMACATKEAMAKSVN